jgi:8-oxo-dGTP pyrophosphatase MutT (NUDIX family)
MAAAYVSKYPTTFYRVSLKAIIRNERGEVLVNKESSSDTWSLPGGGWDHGETEHEALARELHEEVGYIGEFTSTLFSTEVFWLESQTTWLLWIVYEVEPENTNFSVGEHSTDVAFINPNSLASHRSNSEKWIYDNLSA